MLWSRGQCFALLLQKNGKAVGKALQDIAVVIVSSLDDRCRLKSLKVQQLCAKSNEQQRTRYEHLLSSAQGDGKANYSWLTR